MGPNGSGKSNIVEAIRFVLGEQSMKSLRGKGGVDLIFKGSKLMPSASRASVHITFDNSKKVFAFTNSGIGASLDYDEVTISREVFSDGANKYSINGTEVRLKDVVDVLASVNIGSSGHHIISQGEADRVLNASSKDRRSMIEDALGLKVYQYRIKESDRKLEKTIVNMKEISAMRREIAPHMLFLKKQVEKIEKAHALRDELAELYKVYIGAEFFYIKNEAKRLSSLRVALDEKILSLDKRIADLPTEGESGNSENQSGIEELRKEIALGRKASSEISRTLGRIEAMIENARESVAIKDTPERIISESQWQSLVTLCEKEIDNALAQSDFDQVVNILKDLKIKIQNLNSEGSTANDDSRTQEIEEKLADLNEEKRKLEGEMENIANKEIHLQNKINSLEEKDKEHMNLFRESERLRYELIREKNEQSSQLHSLRFEEEKLSQVRNFFETELQEANVLIGTEVLYYKDSFQINADTVIDRATQEDLRRKIERIKIKLEDAGAGNSVEVMKEYDDTVERDKFLEKELEDLNKSITDLRTLIADLKHTLDGEFKSGIERINKQFQEFFALMFGGGTAFLSVIVEHKKTRKDEDIDEEVMPEDEETEFAFERGVEINVSLPQKKVKDLHMLSGGERSLTSIALLFAMSQVNPPPFLVLDETDAALDEANSRKYGNMLENLSKYSELIVVTHNRETMSRAQVLYGVTMDSSGASKLLSIKFEDASNYAK